LKTIEIYSDRKQSLKLLIGSLVFVIGGILMIINSKASSKYHPIYLNIVGTLSIVFFSLGIYISILQLIRNNLIFKIDFNGITYNNNFKNLQFIQWEFITEFKIIKILNQKIILIKVKNPDYFIENEQNTIIKTLMLWNKNKHGTPFALSTNSIKYTSEYFLSILNKNLKESKINK